MTATITNVEYNTTATTEILDYNRENSSYRYFVAGSITVSFDDGTTAEVDPNAADESPYYEAINDWEIENADVADYDDDDDDWSYGPGGDTPSGGLW